MCLAIPGRIVAISATDPSFPVATVEYEGLTKQAQLLYVPDARVGDYVIVQAGFAIRTIAEGEAREALRSASELAELQAGPEAVRVDTSSD